MQKKKKSKQQFFSSPPHSQVVACSLPLTLQRCRRRRRRRRSSKSKSLPTHPPPFPRHSPTSRRSLLARRNEVTSPITMARVTHGVRENGKQEGREIALPAKCLTFRRRCSTKKHGSWGLRLFFFLTFSLFDSTPRPPTTSTKLTLQGPVQPLRSPKRAAAYARSFEGGAGPSGNYAGGLPSMQQPKRECSLARSLFLISFIQCGFPYRRPTPSPLRFALLPLREGRGAGAKSSARRNAGTGESGESRLKGAFEVFFYSFPFARYFRELNRHFFSSSSSTSTSTSLPLSLSLTLSHSLSFLLSHIKKTFPNSQEAVPPGRRRPPRDPQVPALDRAADQEAAVR